MFDFLKKKLQIWIGAEDKKSKTSKKSRHTKKTKRVSQKVPSDKQLAKISRKIKEEAPSKFEPGTLRYEPDYETLRAEQEEAVSDSKKKRKASSHVSLKSSRPQSSQENKVRKASMNWR